MVVVDPRPVEIRCFAPANKPMKVADRSKNWKVREGERET